MDISYISLSQNATLWWPASVQRLHTACALRIDINSYKTIKLWNLYVLRKALDSTLYRIAMLVGLQIQKDVWKHRSTGCNGNADICRIAFQRRHDAVRCSVSFPQNVALLVLSQVHLLGDVFVRYTISWECEGILRFSLGWKVHRKDLPVQKCILRDILQAARWHEFV